jgi:hypothetical protein
MANTLSTISVNEELRERINSKGDDYRAELSRTGWWHSIDPGHGLVTPGVCRLDELRNSYA